MATITLASLDAKTQERFWSKVDRRSTGECWLWTGKKKDGVGYGRFTVGPDHDGAHRIAWMIQNGEIPKGMCMCHRCDVRLCCNPSHLFTGTYKENTRDAISKGRIACGERQGSSKLKLSDVLAIRTMKAAGAKQNAMAAAFGVSTAQISRIVSGSRWAHVL
jgi:hypothetical protein